eukprot:774369_1
MAICEVLKQQLISSTVKKHNVLIQQLDLQYTTFISRLLQQKKHIMAKMQQQLEQHIQHINNMNTQNNNDASSYLSLLSLLLPNNSKPINTFNTPTIEQHNIIPTLPNLETPSLD